MWSWWDECQMAWGGFNSSLTLLLLLTYTDYLVSKKNFRHHATATVLANSDSCSNMNLPSRTTSLGLPTKATLTSTKYNLVCVDSQGQQFSYGTIQGEYAPISGVGNCSTACVEGVSSDHAKAKGCNQHPPSNSNRLIGFTIVKRQLATAFIRQVNRGIGTGKALTT